MCTQSSLVFVTRTNFPDMSTSPNEMAPTAELSIFEPLILRLRATRVVLVLAAVAPVEVENMKSSFVHWFMHTLEYIREGGGRLSTPVYLVFESTYVKNDRTH